MSEYTLNSYAKTEITGMKEQQTWVIALYHIRWYLAGFMGLVVLLMTWRWSEHDEIRQWMHNTWDSAKMLIPLLYGGVFIVGFVSVLLPEKQVALWVGDNSIRANFACGDVICHVLGRRTLLQGKSDTENTPEPEKRNPFVSAPRP